MHHNFSLRINNNIKLKHMIDGFVPFNSETCNLSLNKEEEEDADNAFPMQSILPL